MGGYHDPPWRFRGRALYQLHLVKACDARKFIPSELRLVELFGYTLGGVFLARYADSPVGAFDELVALAGLVWQFPTSFSGGTPEHPGLLRYACQLAARIRLSPCAGIKAERSDQEEPDALAAVLSGRPVLALTFDNLDMRVSLLRIF
ncbi:hypothetical protein WJX81_007214 [Elliptochloris bilobata]|uniref:Uncharacterized protein n=1 Tax=Elliptochloris bilobata TaxID=381761 RepID=A0AAW1RN96_9CHLO